MKLTDEMRSEIAAIWINVAYAARPARAMQDAAERTFLAGYRMGQRDMRERAAKVARDRWDATCGCAACCEDEVIVDCVRSLPIEDANDQG